MAKPNYAFEKRQRERAKKEKKAEKLAQRKVPGDGSPDGAPTTQPGEQAAELPIEDSDAPKLAPRGEHAPAASGNDAGAVRAAP